MVIKAKWNGNADVHMYTFTFFSIKLYSDLPKKSCGDPDVHMYTFTFFSTKLYGHPPPPPKKELR